MEQIPAEHNPEPENRLEKILKEKFGSPDFGSLMNTIVDKMLNNLNDASGKPDKEIPRKGNVS